MAYTYDNATAALKGAKTTEQKLLDQETLKQLGNSLGNQRNQAGTSFQYYKQPAYQDLMGKVINTEAFSYDAQNDPSASALKKTYLREGERARADTMAKVSAATGGAPSSYAVTAAQQAGDYYNTQFTDKLIDLEENAYQRYMNDFDMNMSKLNAMNADREFDYNAYMQNYEQGEAARKEKRNNLLTLVTNYGYEPTEKELEEAGLTKKQLDAILGRNGGTTGTAAAGNGRKWDQGTYNTQVYLQSLGYPVAADGIWGDETDKYYNIAMGNGPGTTAATGGTALDGRFTYNLK